jgi:hypothetical protein
MSGPALSLPGAVEGAPAVRAAVTGHRPPRRDTALGSLISTGGPADGGPRRKGVR